nr:MAG TPA: hypothetical protein [Caudoviricetes sp.]
MQKSRSVNGSDFPGLYSVVENHKPDNHIITGK